MTSTSGQLNSVVPLLETFSAMRVDYNGTSNGTSFSEQGSYAVVYSSATTIKVTITTTFQTSSSSSGTETLTAWILKNDTVVAIDEAGFNLTGSEGQTVMTGLFGGFVFEVDAGQSLGSYTSSSFATKTGTSQVTLGGHTFTVTDYALSGSSQTLNICGSSDSYTKFTLAVGTPSGTNYPLITSFSEAGTFTDNGQVTTEAVIVQITSLTIA
ncbi:MAG: hypothetical protein OK456_04225 [Thaumarchaeota archaeon]|nr:hypothetical protein [Nitrososphaerota archaeon]